MPSREGREQSMFSSDFIILYKAFLPAAEFSKYDTDMQHIRALYRSLVEGNQQLLG